MAGHSRIETEHIASESGIAARRREPWQGTPPLSSHFLAGRDLQADLIEHIRALGVDSVVGYMLWCYRNGFDKGLEKTPAQRQAELDFLRSQGEDRDPDIVPQHDPRRAAYMARIFDGELQNDKLSDVLFRVRTMYNNLEGDAGAQQALKRLVLRG